MPDESFPYVHSHTLTVDGDTGRLALFQGSKSLPFHVEDKQASNFYHAQGHRIRFSGNDMKAIRYLFDEKSRTILEVAGAKIRISLL